MKKRLFVCLTLFTLLRLADSSAQGIITPPERSPFSLHARFGLLTNNPDLAVKLYDKRDSANYRTLNTGYMAAPELSLNIDIVRYRAMVFGAQLTAVMAQPGLHVKGDGVDYLAGLTDLYMAKGTLWFSFNTSGDPYSLFSLPYHSQGESVIGITGAFLETKDVLPTKEATDSLGITELNGNTCRALGVYIGWNWRLGQSGWVFGISGSVMWEWRKNYLINFETTDEAK
ncbi:MAG: hypothetical protein ACKOKF_04790, partial [Bacteroidota bacterium]